MLHFPEIKGLVLTTYEAPKQNSMLISVKLVFGMMRAHAYIANQFCLSFTKMQWEAN